MSCSVYNICRVVYTRTNFCTVTEMDKITKICSFEYLSRIFWKKIKKKKNIHKFLLLSYIWRINLLNIYPEYL